MTSRKQQFEEDMDEQEATEARTNSEKRVAVLREIKNQAADLHFAHAMARAVELLAEAKTLVNEAMDRMVAAERICPNYGTVDLINQLSDGGPTYGVNHDLSVIIEYIEEAVTDYNKQQKEVSQEDSLIVESAESR